MENSDTSTVLALIFLASAVVLIGGLIAIPMIESAEAVNAVSDSRSKGQQGESLSGGKRRGGGGGINT